MKWMVGGLAVSLALNFIVIGLIIGWMATGPGPQHQARGGGYDFSLRKISQILEPDSRALLRQKMDEQRSTLGPLFKERRETRRATAAVMRADPFDPAALDAAFTRMWQADMALQTAIQAILVDVASHLSPEERAKIADWREREHRKSLRPPHAHPFEGPPEPR